MLERVMHGLALDHKEIFTSVEEPAITLIQKIDYPNSQIARLKLGWKERDVVVFVKVLYEDLVDGKTNRSDLEYKEQQIRTEYDVLGKLYEYFDEHENVGVITPLICFPDCLAHVTLEAEGSKLSSLMGDAKVFGKTENFKKLLQSIRQVGRWLHLFQGFPSYTIHTAKEFDVNDVFSYCQIRLERLSQARPNEFTAQFCNQFMQVIQATGEGISFKNLEISCRHNDFGPNNILVSEEKLIVLDFGGFNYGPSCCDFIKFWSELEILRTSPFISHENIDSLQAAFLAGFGREFDIEDPTFAFFEAVYLIDKIDEIITAWQSLSWIQRFAYLRLYRKLVHHLEGRVLILKA